MARSGNRLAFKETSRVKVFNLFLSHEILSQSGDSCRPLLQTIFLNAKDKIQRIEGKTVILK